MSTRDADGIYARWRAVFDRYAVESDGFYSSAARAQRRHTLFQTALRRLLLGLAGRAVRDGARTVLDAGCGRGDFAVALARRHARLRRCTGADFSPASLAIGRRDAGADARLSFVGAHLLELPFRTGSFDLVVCMNVLHHVPADDQPRALSELARVATGWLLLEVKNARSLYHRHIHPGRVDGIPVHPATARDVARILAPCGLTLAGRRGLPGPELLSPSLCLLFRR